MGYFYVIISATLVLISDRFFGIFSESYSWWLTPLLLVGFWILFVLIHILTVVVMILTENMNIEPKGTSIFRYLLKTGLPIVFKLAGVKFEMDGIEKLPKDTRMMVVCNHQHDFDPAVILNAFPDAHLSFVGKKDILTEMPLVSKAMHKLGCLFIDRENDREAAKTIVQAIKLIKEDKTSIALFPEGYTSRTDELLPLRSGSLKVAVKSKAPLVVCVLDGTKNMAKSLFRKHSTVHFRLLDVIYPEDFEGMKTTELGDIIHGKMQDALNDIRKSSM